MVKSNTGAGDNLNSQSMKIFEAAQAMPNPGEEIESRFIMTDLKAVYAQVFNGDQYSVLDHAVWNWFVLNSKLFSFCYTP